MTILTPPAAEPVLTPRRCRVAHSWLSDEDHGKLERAANGRRMHPDAVSAEILRQVLIDDETIDFVLSGGLRFIGG